MNVVQHARVPIIKAQATGRGDSGDSYSFNIDISIDGPTHSGLATTAFTSYLSSHLPNLAPLTIVLKSLLQVGPLLIRLRLIPGLLRHGHTSVGSVHPPVLQPAGAEAVICEHPSSLALRFCLFVRAKA